MNRLLPALVVAASLIMPGIAFSQASAVPASAPGAKLAATDAALRDLWLQHIVWVRNVVVSRISGNPAAAKAAEAEVVTNAKAIAAAIEPYYGNAASEQLFTLLAGHWGAISAYLDATKARTPAAQDAAAKQLADNAAAIAEFLGKANPNLPADQVRGLLTAHGAHHLEQIRQIAGGQFEQEARTWAAMSKHVYAIADALANGIAKQFPQKFS